MTENHHRLNLLCMTCGDYASAKCVNCPVEISRQQEVLNGMKLNQSNTYVFEIQNECERFPLIVSA